MSHPLKKDCGEPAVNQRCAPFQQISDPMLPSSSIASQELFAGEEDTGWGSALASSTTTSTTSTTGVGNTAHPGAYADASLAARTAYRTPPTPSTVTYPADYWRRNLMGNSTYNSYSPSMHSQMPMYPPSGGPSSCLPFTLQSGYGAPQTMFGCATPPSEAAGLVQYAHEHSRGVFDKAAYAIQTVGSITHMLDTIFMGCTGSFNAILTVIGQLSQLKNHFGRVISAFAVLRSIRWLYARVLRALGLRSAQDVEDAWREAMESMADRQSGSAGGSCSRSRGSWRRAVLVACLCALPALLWQLMKVMANNASGEAGETPEQRNEHDTSARLDGGTDGVPKQQGFSDPRIAPNPTGYPQPVNPAYGSLGGYGTPSMTAGGYPYGANSGGYNPYMGGGSLYGGYTPAGYPSSYSVSPCGSSYSGYGSPYLNYNSSGANYLNGIGGPHNFNSNYSANGLRSNGGGVPSNSAPQRRFPGQPPSNVVSQKNLVGKEAAKSVYFADQPVRVPNATTAPTQSNDTGKLSY